MATAKQKSSCSSAKKKDEEIARLKRSLKRAKQRTKKLETEATNAALSPVVEHYTDEWGGKHEINHEMGG